MRRVLARTPAQLGPVRYSTTLLVYVGGVVTAAAVVAGFTVRPGADLWSLLVAVVAASLLAPSSVRSISGVDVPFSVTVFLHLGILFTLGPTGAVVATLAEVGGASMRLRTGWFRSSFNLGGIFLSDMASWGVYLALHHLPLPHTAAVSVAGLGAGCCLWLTNNGMVAAAVAITKGDPLDGLRLLRRLLTLLPYTAAYGFAALALPLMHERDGAVGIVMALVPLAAAQSFLVILERRTASHERERAEHLRRIEEQNAALEVEKSRVEMAHAATLIALTHALDARDRETEGHSRRVVEYTRLTGARLGVTGDDLKALAHGALLHDIGKIGVPDRILHKPGPLDEREWELMRRHPEMGAAMIEDVEMLKEARRLILHHHERWDGRGYPRGLRGRQIGLGARVFAVCDSFDALTHDRPYRRACSIDQAREELLRCRGTDFDPDTVDAFLTLSEAEVVGIRALRTPAGVDLLTGDDVERDRYLEALGLGIRNLASAAG